MKYTAYNTTTGQILWHYTDSDDQGLTSINGEAVIPEHHRPDKFYIDVATKQPVAIPDKPLSITTQYTFDWTAKTWQVDTEATEKEVRKIRSEMLAVIDKVNPIWYAEMSDQQRQELSAYRQALLDVPQQTSWPTDISWPAKPEWL